MIPQKTTSFTHPSVYKFTHWLLAACLLAGSAIATTADAQVTILATNQGNVTNINADESRVYWINVNNSTVSSVDKINGGVVRIHSPARTLYGSNIPANGGDIVQDSTNLYFVSNTGGPDIGINSTYNVYRVPKTSSGATLLTPVPPPTDTDPDPAERNPGNPALGITTNASVDGNPITALLYFSGHQNLPDGIPGVPPGDGSIGTIEVIDGDGATVPEQFIPFTTEPNWEPNLIPNHFSSESTHILFSNVAAANPGILGLEGDVGTGSWYISAAASSPGALSTPDTGPAKGYTFWEDTTSTTTNLVRKRPNEAPLVLLAGVWDTGQSSFVQAGTFVYCIRKSDGTIVSVPIDGGASTLIVGTVDAFGPSGVTSDGNYLYWAAAGDGSIRRIPLLTANNSYTITTGWSPANGGITSGAGAYAVGTVVTVVATANLGFTFLNWTENGTVVSTSASYTFTVNSNRSLVANFTSPLPKTATPTIHPHGGRFSHARGGAIVKLACATPGATIYYTKDGSDPTTSSIMYPKRLGYIGFKINGPAGSTKVVNAIAIAPGHSNSDIATASFIFRR